MGWTGLRFDRGRAVGRMVYLSKRPTGSNERPSRGGKSTPEQATPADRVPKPYT